MTQLARHALRHVYYQHGLFSFLLFFVPLLPGIIENHTKLYLKFAHALTGDAKDAHEAVKQMFGNRGVVAYEQFLETNPQLIRPSVIFRTIYETSELDTGLNLIQELFTNPHQRKQPHADTFRASVIREIHRFFHAYKEVWYQTFRSRLIELVATNAEIEKGLEPKIATADICWELLQTTHTIEHARRSARESAKFNLLEAAIKSKLVGKATAGDHEFTKLYDVHHFHKHVLTQTDVDCLKKIVFHLQHDPAPDVWEVAGVHARNLQALTLQLT